MGPEPPLERLCRLPLRTSRADDRLHIDNHEYPDIGEAASSGRPELRLLSTVPLFTGKINQNTALAGVVLRPTDKWRVNADAELMYADNTFTYIGPRHEQRVRANTVYKLNRWASINAGVHVIESRNDFATDINQSGLNLFSVSGAGTGASPYVATTNQPAYGNKNHCAITLSART